MKRQITLAAVAMLGLACSPGASAQTTSKIAHPKKIKMAHQMMYMDMQEHEWYTVAQAKIMHYKSDTGHTLVKVASMPAGAKPTDDKMPAMSHSKMSH